RPVWAPNGVRLAFSHFGWRRGMRQRDTSSWATKLGAVTRWGLMGLVGLLGLGGTVLLVVEMAVTGAAAFRATPAHQPALVARRTATETTDYLVSPQNIDSAKIDVERAVASRRVPGAVLAVGDRGHILQMAGYGRVGWRASDEPVSPDSTVYDLASLT